MPMEEERNRGNNTGRLCCSGARFILCFEDMFGPGLGPSWPMIISRMHNHFSFFVFCVEMDTLRLEPRWVGAMRMRPCVSQTNYTNTDTYNTRSRLG